MSDGEENTRQWRVGDTANGYVLTPEGWQPLPPDSAGGTPTLPLQTNWSAGANPQYQIGDVANGYVLTPQGWRPASPQPAYGNGPGGPGPGGPPRSRKGLYIALAVAAVVILGVAAAGTYAWVSLQSSSVASPKPSTTRTAPTTSATTSSPSSPSSPTSTPSGSGSTSTRPTPTTGTAAPNAKAFTYGEVGTLTQQGLDAADLRIDRPVPFDPVTAIDQPEQGQLIYVPVAIKVVGKDPVEINDFDFVAVLPDGQQLESVLVADLPKGAPTALDSHDVKPGETLTGAVVFDVPKGVGIRVAYQPDQQILGTWTD